MRCLCLGLTILVASATIASADTSTSDNTLPDRPLAVSVSLATPTAMLGQLSVEYHIGGSSALGAALSGGPVPVVAMDEAGDFSSSDELCIGSHVMYHYYLNSYSRGFFAGGEAMYNWVNRDQDHTVPAGLEGLWIGPKVGYKYSFGSGLTLAASFGVNLRVYRPDGVDEDEVPGGIDNGFMVDLLLAGPILIGPNLFLGWSF